MKKSTGSKTQSQLKSSLKQLHKMGLYDPKHPRRAPTAYAKTLVRRYTQLGVLGNKPRSEVIKVPTSVAKKISGEFRVKRTKKGSVAIVPKRAGTRAYYSKKAGTIVRTQGVWKFTLYHDNLVFLLPVSDWPPSPNLEDEDEEDGDYERGDIYRRTRRTRTLYPFAFPRGNGFSIFYNAADILRDMMEYDPSKTTLWQYPHLARKK